MPTTKRIVCLANSRKRSARCIAGRELVDDFPGDWIRPISTHMNPEIPERKCQYEDGSDLRLLDIVDIPLQKHQPWDHQQENWLLDLQDDWRKVAKYSWNDLQKLSETGGTLWRNGYHTRTTKGHNNQIPLDQAKKETCSLKLIHIDKLSLYVYAPYKDFGRPDERRVQGKFYFNDNYYALRITDLDIEEAYLKREDGNYNLGECYLTISLGNPFNGYCHKLIAAVMEKPR